MAHLTSEQKKYLDELKQDLDTVKKPRGPVSTPDYPRDFNHQFPGVYDFYSGFAHYNFAAHETILLEKIYELETHPAKRLEQRLLQFKAWERAYGDDFYEYVDVENELHKIRELEKEVDTMKNGFLSSN
jgi:hypothetical protein